MDAVSFPGYNLLIPTKVDVDAQVRHHCCLGGQRLVGYLAGRSVGHIEMVRSMPGHELVARNAVQQGMHNGPLRGDGLQSSLRLLGW